MMQRIAEPASPTSSTVQSLAIISAINKSVYTNDAGFSETSIAYFVAGAERSDNKCIKKGGVFQRCSVWRSWHHQNCDLHRV